MTTSICHTRIFETLVRQFHDSFDCPKFSHPDYAPFDIHKLRARLIAEELEELMTAKNKVDELDAICDLIYVVAGTAVTYSTPIKDYSTKLRFDPAATRPNIPLLCRAVTNDLHTLFPCQLKLTESINPVLAGLDDLAALAGYSLLNAFMAVHKSNMDKLWDQDPATVTIKHPIKSTKKGAVWLVRDLGGKVIKPPWHTKVNLLPFI